MNILLTIGTTVIPISIFKSAILTIVTLLWARWATMLDKDAELLNLPRRMLNLAQISVMIFALLIALFIPIFFIGLPLSIIIIIGAGIAYASLHNNKAPDAQQWSLSADFFRDVLMERKQGKALKQAKLRFVVGASQSSHNFKPVPLQDSPNYAPHLALEQLIETALDRNSQRIEIGVSGHDVSMQVVNDGVNYKIDALSATETFTMINYLKGECELDVQDTRKSQTGFCRCDALEKGQHTFRVNVKGSTRALLCTIDVDHEKQMGIPFDKLGLLDSQLQQLQPVLDSTQRVVLITSPKDHGRTSTLYAILQQPDPYMMDIQTIEKEIEHSLEGVTQKTPTSDGMSKNLQSLLLNDPQLVMLSHIADKDIPRIIAKAGLDNKRIYVGLQGKDTFATLKMWAKAVGDLKLLSESLDAIITQKLLRKLCATCRQGYTPEPDALKKLNLPVENVKQLYKSSGKVLNGNKEETCPICNGLGYLGRTAAFEVMVLDDDGRKLLAAGKLGQLRSHLRKNNMTLLQEAALAKVVSGETSISEVMRVFSNQN